MTNQEKIIEVIKEDIVESFNGDTNEVVRYFNSFRQEPDYNIANYGNLLIYYEQVRNFFQENGLTKLYAYSDTEIWNKYRYLVGLSARRILKDIKYL